MQSILSVFKSRYFWIGFGFVLLIALTLGIGWWLDWSMVTQLKVIIGLLVVCLGIVVYEFVRASRSAQKIEASIKKQAEQQRVRSRPDRQPDIEELQERLEEAIARLKQSDLGRGRRGRNALYALPWYMMIGPPGAGKTTAIKNSGLNFPVGPDRVRGVGGTRNCDWFFTDQAILLDTAGRYMTERENEEEWHAFLDMLKEHRPHRPINGVIVGVSIEELLGASPGEIERHARDVRRRVSELVERLGVRFPVYLVFMKCDLMQGFVQFFGEMTRQEREQIWGCTLTEEQREEGTAREVFEHEFDLLYDALIDARSGRLSRSMKREERRRVYVFPLEFASARENLSLFVGQLFQPNPYQESPEFRGFYFTSGTQEGVPIDHVIQSISQEFDFASGLEPESEPDREKKSYFIKDLFTHVIIPDQYLVEETAQSARWGRVVQWGVGAVSAAVLALFIVGLSQALWRSQSELAEVTEVAQAAAGVQWEQTSEEDFEALNKLHRRITDLEEHEAHPPILRWGLYRGGEVLEPARSLYYQKLRPLMQDQFDDLERRLQERDVNSLNERERRELRTELENYLLLSDSSDALDRKSYRSQLVEYLTDQMSQTAPSFASGGRGRVEQHVSKFVEGIRNQHLRPFRAQSSLVEDLTPAVQQPITLNRIYSRIQQEVDLPSVTLSDVLGQGQRGRSLFAGQPEVSGFYTKQGWDNVVENEIQQVAEQPGESGGLIGRGSNQLPEELQNPDRVEEELRKKYFSEYVAAWREFLGRLRYDASRGLRGRAQDLQILGDEFESPLIRILERVEKETTFESLTDDAVQQVQGEVDQQGQGSDDVTSDHPVTRELQWVHRLVDGTVQGANLTEFLSALREVGTLLQRMEGDPRQAYDFAKGVLEGDGGEMEQHMRTLRDALSQSPSRVRERLFKAPLLRAWEAVLAETQRYLNDRWQRDVHQFYQSNLQGRYPFDPDREQEASPRRVQEFFRPEDGVVETFRRDHLDAFLRDEEGRPKTWERQGITISPAASRALDRINLISSGLFAGGGGAFGLSFELKPYDLRTEGDGPPAGAVSIQIHGESLRYTGGQSYWREFFWPGDPGVTLTVQTRDGTMEPRQWDGQWAWFRLLEEAQVFPQTATDYRIGWSIQPPSGRYTVITRYDLRAEAASELFTQKPSGFFALRIPETLD